MMKEYVLKLPNGTLGEVSVTDNFIQKLIEAGYSPDSLESGKNLLELVCKFAINADVEPEDAAEV